MAIDYPDIIAQINSQINQFNYCLSSHCKLQLLRPECYFDIECKGWWDINLGEVAFKGVYIIVATADETDTLALYIGKASLNSSIARRLNAHLSKSRKPNSKGFNYYQQPYTLHRVYTINLDNMAFIAPALEEYLIMNLTTIPLLNEIGNY